VGNPLALFGQSIAREKPVYASRTRSYCAGGDPICANGSNPLAHLAHGIDGDAAAGGAFAAARARP
jgi:cutinase